MRRVTFDDNPFFPEVLAKERDFDAINKRGRYGHIWLGEYEHMAIGAIWDRVILREGRRAEAPEMGRIVVSVDHAVSSEPGSDEHGIIVAGVGDDKRGYVQADMSTRGSPSVQSS